MDCARNIITANFGGGTSATTAPLWQWDYGQVLCITGIEDLPAAFEVHFSTNRTGGVSTVAVGADGQVTIPNVLLTIGKNLNAWIYLSDAQGEGETEYSITIPVKARPMPETYDAEASGEFDDVVRQISEYAETAQTAADNAGASATAAAASADNAAASASAAETAKTAAETAQGKAEDAQAAAETAAQTATEKAQQTAQDAAQAAQSKADAEAAADHAEASQTGAESAKADAETAAQGAADSASAASASATSAGQSATSAGQSATAAAGSATTAGNAAQTATTKAGEAFASADAAAASETAAQTAQTAAETAATNAGQSASTATTKAAEAAQSASNAAASETAAEAAATRAETAAASIVVDDALSDTSENPVQNKVITGEVTQVKSAFDAVVDTEVHVSPNLLNFNDSDFVTGKYLNPQNNTLNNNSSYNTSGYIPVEEGATYTYTHGIPLGTARVINFLCAYDSQKQHIRDASGSSLSNYTVPTGVAYIRFSATSLYFNEDSTSVMLYKGTTIDQYYPYHEPYTTRQVKDEALNTTYINSLVDTALSENESIQKIDEITEEWTAQGELEEYSYSDFTWATGVLYSNGTVYTGGSYDSFEYCYINVAPGYKVSTAYGQLRDVCCLLDDVVVPGGVDPANGIKTFEVPSGVNKLGLTRHTLYSSYAITVKKVSQKTEITSDSLLKNVPEIALDAVAKSVGAVVPKNTSFFYVSGNLINPDDIVHGEYVSQSAGSFVENSAHQRTGYLPVESGETYCIHMDPESESTSIRYAFYTEYKVFISGALVVLDDIGHLVTAPATAKYIAISMGAYEWQNVQMMIKKSSVDVNYESYGYAYILPEYIKKDYTSATVNLPSKIYALVGYELNVYFENLVEDWEKYHWDVSCQKGQQLERGYRVTPTGDDVGEYQLTITLDDGDTKTTVSTTLAIIAASAGSGVSKSVMIIGDSTTNNGIAVTKLNENFASDVMSISTIGTRGTAPNNHEGRSGWRFSNYFAPVSQNSDVENPWYNPSTETFDASYYFAQTGIEKPDWFFINLGINDVFSYLNDATLQTQIDACESLCDSMIASVQSASPNTKIGVCLTIPPNHSQDAFGKAYQCSQTRDRYKRNNVLWVNALISKYDGKESDGIYLVPIYTNLDTVYNMGLESIPVNARNSTTYNSPIGNGGVHPVESGYWQIADVYTAFLKAHAST